MRKSILVTKGKQKKRVIQRTGPEPDQTNPQPPDWAPQKTLRQESSHAVVYRLADGALTLQQAAVMTDGTVTTLHRRAPATHARSPPTVRFSLRQMPKVWTSCAMSRKPEPPQYSLCPRSLQCDLSTTDTHNTGLNSLWRVAAATSSSPLPAAEASGTAF